MLVLPIGKHLGAPQHHGKKVQRWTFLPKVGRLMLCKSFLTNICIPCGVLYPKLLLIIPFRTFARIGMLFMFSNCIILFLASGSKKRTHLLKPFPKHFMRKKTSFLNSWSVIVNSDLLEDCFVKIQIPSMFPDKSVKSPRVWLFYLFQFQNPLFRCAFCERYPKHSVKYYTI